MEDYIRNLIAWVVTASLILNFALQPYPVKAQIKIEIPIYDGNLITEHVIYKPNIPTTAEEIEAVRRYNAQQAWKMAVFGKRTKTNQAQSAASLTNQIKCSCVLYAQYKGLGISGYGNAKNYPINSKIPIVGGYVVTYESGRGHMAKIMAIEDDLILDESNYERCQITQGRKLPINSPLIKGFII